MIRTALQLAVIVTVVPIALCLWVYGLIWLGHFVFRVLPQAF